jgi:hypothetical protein
MRKFLVLSLLLSFVGACSDDSNTTGGTAGTTGDTGADGGAAGAGEGSAGSGSAGNGTGSAGNGGSGSGTTGPIPMFPGAGTSDDSKPLVGGMVCDSVPGATQKTVSNVTRCFFGADDKMNPAATIEQVLECADESGTLLHLRLTFAPTFVDNTYGENAVGWPLKGGKKGEVRPGHTFKDLVGSDHAELVLMNGDGEVAMQFKMDYISEDPTAPSGYDALGVTGGEGEVAIGDAAHVVRWSTSLDRNLNDRGYAQYTTDSPATDESFTSNPDAPEWDYRVVFDVWIDLAAFGDSGFEGAFIEYVHASPAKYTTDTIETEPGECPPTWDPCLDEDADTVCNEPPSDDPCTDNDPDTYCAETPTDGGTGTECPSDAPDNSCGTDAPPPPSEEPAYCDRYPTDPACTPE